MEKKLTIIAEVVIFVVVAIIFTVKNVIPEVKSTIGSSDGFIKTGLYQNMYEINIDNNVRFSFIINENGRIYHMLFFNMNSTCLYNKSIENYNNLDDALLSSVKILIEDDYLKNTSLISVTKYGNYYYDEFMKSFKSSLNRYGINSEIIVSDNSLEALCSELGIEEGKENTNDYYLRELDLYSKEITRVIKNNISYKNENNNGESIRIDNAREYTNNVYKKIEKYILSNNITNLDRYNNNLPITSIPADKGLKYYPSPNSWYYVKDGKLYAYIEIIDNGTSYGYCYNGSIDMNKKGECV